MWTDAPVVIVGAGPAGLVLGFVLHGAGVPFTIVERRAREQIGGPPKAGSIDYRTVELLTREGISPGIVEFTVRNGVCEFRTPDDRVIIDYGALTGGRPHFILPQQIVVERLCQGAVEAGFDIRFETSVAHAERRLGQEATVVVDAAGQQHELQPRLLVGCDGARSTIAPLIDARTHDYAPPARLLAMIGDTPPIARHTVYAAHPEGYAAQMRRTETQTRFYLEIDDAIEDWSADQARAALTTRLGLGRELDGVGLGDFSIVDLKVRMRESMQQGDVFVVGDAAHVISPFGGKGMNLAIADAVELGHAIAEYLSGGDGRARLDAYSSTRLPVIWRTQAFSNWMMRTVLTNAATATADAPMFAHHLGRGWVSALQTDPLLARWFAHAYAGADPRADVDGVPPHS
jgi:p-hydroxybenzoate 3-monooxygenase